jgi:hypothetical protein
VAALGLRVEALGLGVVVLGLRVELVMAPGAVALRLGVILAIALLTEPPHPAAMLPAARIATERKRILLNRRMPNPSAQYP